MFARVLRRIIALSVIFIGCTASSGTADQEIRIGKPKIWRYDRMYPVLDGLLRDVEGVSLASLTGLDASAVNSRVIDLLQSYFNASVSADQTAAITNGINLDVFNSTRKSQLSTLQQQASATQTLAQERAVLTQSLTAAIDARNKRAAVLTPGTTCDKDPQCAQDQQTITDIQNQLTQLQTASSTAPAPPTVSAPTLTGVAGTPAGTTPTLASGINPTDFVSKALTADPQQVGSLPAREKLESFITLLNDRLTKQLALSLDEQGLGGRYIPFVVEFDVSIEPHANRKNEEAVATFDIIPDSSSCGHTPIVYNLYPSMSAFNVANVSGSSSGFYLNGAFKGLFVGSTAGYQRQKDHISQSMRQSVYLSGFRTTSGQSSTVGWYYGAPSYTNIVRAGEYSTFAVVLVPKMANGSACSFSITPKSYWRTQSGRQKDQNSFPATDFTEPQILSEQTPYIQQVQYYPHYGSVDALKNDVNVISVEFEDPINPNLLLTASGKLIKRVRDWRGRATSPSTSDTISVTNASGTSISVSRERGLFEADIDDPDTWIAVSQTKILIKLSYATAGSSSFPDIQVLIPGKKGWDLRTLVDYKTYSATITIGDRVFRACHPKFSAYSADPSRYNQGCMPQPLSMWVPLFSTFPSPNHLLRVLPVAANLPGQPQDAPDNSGRVGQIGEPGSMGEQWYFYITLDDGDIALSKTAQLIINTPGHYRFVHPVPMECATVSPGLLCHIHPASVVFSTPVPAPPAIVLSSSRSPLNELHRSAGGRLVEASAALTEESDLNDAGSPSNVPSTSNDLDPEVDPSDACLTVGDDGKPSIRHTDICNWHNYRLQIQVFQAALETRPAIWESAALPDILAKVPIVGRVRKVSPIRDGKTEQWSLEIPTLYLGSSLLSFCTAERISLPGPPLSTTIIANSSRESTIRLALYSGSLAAFTNGTAHAYSGPCTDKNSIDLGAVTGVKDLLFPSDLQLSQPGNDSSIFQFTGTNLGNVDAFLVGDKGPKITAWHTESSSLVANLGSTKLKNDEILFFDIAGQSVPVLACWDQATAGAVNPASNSVNGKTCGAVIVKATAPSNVAKAAPGKAANKPKDNKAKGEEAGGTPSPQAGAGPPSGSGAAKLAVSGAETKKPSTTPQISQSPKP
ncbi:MAG TPA: hypothetical protein VMT53_07795 [Terriglobales bacterium]|nr:hypothetical protein [Terriglobales bacterium]